MSKDLKIRIEALVQEMPAARYNCQGMTVVVTGGAQGIGRCLSLSFAACGADVIMMDINDEALAEAAWLYEQIKPLLTVESEGSVIPVHTDLANRESIMRSISECKQQLDNNGLYLLINNAAIADAHSAHLLGDPEAYDHVLAVNLRAPYLVSSMLEPWLSRTRGSSIINIASTRAYMSEPLSEGYGSSKGGVVALTHAMAATLADRGVRVNCISPGWIATEHWQLGLPQAVEFSEEDHNQHPAGRIGRPADIAAACLFLASEDAGFITGVNLTVDGGMTHKMIYK